MARKDISLQEKRNDPTLVEVTIHGKPYFVSKTFLLNLEQEYAKEQKRKKKEKTCFSGTYACPEDFIRVSFDGPY